MAENKDIDGEDYCFYCHSGDDPVPNSAEPDMGPDSDYDEESEES